MKVGENLVLGAVVDSPVAGKSGEKKQENTAAHMLARLRARFPRGEYAVFANVADATGFEGKRYADAIGMSLWPSRGLSIHGFEIKVSRADWQRELKDPAKSEAFMRYCDRWWLVASDRAIVKPGELPPTWGLLVPRGDGLVVAVEAPQLEAQPMSKPFLAALLRRASEASVDESVIKEAEERGRKNGREQANVQSAYDLRQANRKLEQLQEVVRGFEEASGVSIAHGWNIGEIGSAVKFVRDGGLARARQDVDALIAKARAQVLALEALDVRNVEGEKT